MNISWVTGLLAALSLPGMAWARASSQEGPAPTPDEHGHILKMTREMIQLGTTKDHGQRVELFLRIAGERVRELQATQDAGRGSQGPALERCYETLVSRGAVGTIEQGAARGHDMNAETLRVGEVTSRQRESWMEFVGRIPPAQRSAYSGALEASDRAGALAREAQERGLWENFERRRVEQTPKTPLPGPSETGPRTPRPLETEEARKDRERKEAETPKGVEERAKTDETPPKDPDDRPHSRGSLHHHRH